MYFSLVSVAKAAVREPEVGLVADEEREELGTLVGAGEEIEAVSAPGKERRELEALLRAGEETEVGSAPGEERGELEVLLGAGEEVESEENKVGEAGRSNGDEDCLETVEGLQDAIEEATEEAADIGGFATSGEAILLDEILYFSLAAAEAAEVGEEVPAAAEVVEAAAEKNEGVPTGLTGEDIAAATRDIKAPIGDDGISLIVERDRSGDERGDEEAENCGGVGSLAGDGALRVRRRREIFRDFAVAAGDARGAIDARTGRLNARERRGTAFLGTKEGVYLTGATDTLVERRSGGGPATARAEAEEAGKEENLDIFCV